VGLIYQSPREISRLAMEFIRHYEHYRVTARQFARGYREYHNSRRLVQELNGTVERRILEMVP
jgi:hypothetical protein